ncbi:MAG: type I DNA topoisomerase, partial [bacterium]|nr:type I DNA topoisomerase [bacterium]
MKLVIVESPTKAKTIGKFLGKDFKVESSYGHIRDLPKNNKKAIDIKGDFAPHYEIVKGKENMIESLRGLAHKANEVFLATDPDREGEAIAWHLFVTLNLDHKKAKRIAFHEITEEAIEEAVAHPLDIDEDLRRAQEARRVLDRLVGYDLSGLIWKKVRYGLSAGRVQSPALRIIMEREREIRAFTPEKFWVLTGMFNTVKHEKLALVCAEEPREEGEAKRILAAGLAGTWQVTDVKESEMKRYPRTPFTTSTLQQTASTRLGFSPSRTMATAQKLYEAGHITYMRTDSTMISTQAQKQILAFIQKRFGKVYAEGRIYKTKSKLAQEAHEAIRPTNASIESAGSTPEQNKLYHLIWQRAIGSQMKEALLLKTRITANIKDDIIPEFTTTGSRLLFDGWLKADPEAHGEDIEVPKVKTNDPLKLKDLVSEEKQTEAPNRYTEAGLVKELERRGIGRPSTYASITKTLADRGYVIKTGKTLFPTDVGDVVSTFLEKNFGSYVSDTFTAEMEDKLDEIAKGSREYKKTLKDFYGPFSKEVASKEDIPKLTNLGDAPKEFICPKCDSLMVMKLGKNGTFMSCSRFPECTGARGADGSIMEPEKPIGEDPSSGLPIFVLNGRFGPYVQIGQKSKEHPKPKRASIPKSVEPSSVTLVDALTYLSLPRELGLYPQTGKMITASIGRFGPYIVHDHDFRSLKKDNVYTIELPRALEILKEEKKR